MMTPITSTPAPAKRRYFLTAQDPDRRHHSERTESEGARRSGLDEISPMKPYHAALPNTFSIDGFEQVEDRNHGNSEAGRHLHWPRVVPHQHPEGHRRALCIAGRNRKPVSYSGSHC